MGLIVMKSDIEILERKSISKSELGANRKRVNLGNTQYTGGSRRQKLVQARRQQRLREEMMQSEECNWNERQQTPQLLKNYN